MKRKPLYQLVMNSILERIESGEWKPGTRLPTEIAFCKEFSASRMTINRALRELSSQGLIYRVQGAGTFVSNQMPQSAELLDIHNIATEIEQRGHRHTSTVHLLQEEKADNFVATSLGLEPGASVFHSVVVHREENWCIQLEDRYVNPEVGPDYLLQDFTKITPNKYLMRLGPIEQTEHIVEAMMPDERIQELLKISEKEPCLLLHRRTWTHSKVATRAWLYHPGSRYRLGTQFSAKK
ncbi:MAG: histidine utilization repressor [Rhodospirillales bacterium]|jgi:GntR family transcriptional regulator, histidine utilization repressor|nr:histidine utilization repressor [Rhodospirillales bacterium]